MTAGLAFRKCSTDEESRAAIVPRSLLGDCMRPSNQITAKSGLRPGSRNSQNGVIHVVLNIESFLQAGSHCNDVHSDTYVMLLCATTIWMYLNSSWC